MSTYAVSTIAKELGPGEKLLWSGQPLPGIRFRSADAFLIPFSLLWCGFAIFWEIMALTAIRKAGVLGLIFPLFGMIFVVVGLYFVFGRFIVDALARKRTFYAITSERILIISGLFSRRTKSLNLRTLSDISLTERSNGNGTVTFGGNHPFGQWFPAGGWPGAAQYAAPAFDIIANARQVYEMIRQAQKSAS